MKRTEAIKLIAQDKIRNLTKIERENYLRDWWVGEEDEDLQRLPEIVKDEISHSLKMEIENNDTFQNIEDKRYHPIILLGVYAEFRGVKNSYLEREIQRIKGEKIIVTGIAKKLEKCPCCGYRTLDKKCDWEICVVCFWEDDCTTSLDRISGPNHITLREGRENFLRFGASTKRSVEFVDQEGKLKYER